MANLYDIGDLVRLTGNFKDVNNVLTDPSIITLEVIDPALKQTNYVYGIGNQIVKSSTGIYYTQTSPDQSGKWQYRWLGTGAVTTAEAGFFYVRASAFV
jgi:hypothetical protein